MIRATDSPSELASQPTISEVDPNDNRWDDWEAGEEDTPPDMQCLFCSKRFQSAGEVFHHGQRNHGFDFMATRLTHRLDFYQCIRLINYLRRKQLEAPDQVVASFSIDGTEPFFRDDQFLQPVIEGDALLFAFDDVFGCANSEFSIRSARSDCMSNLDGETLLYRFKEVQAQLVAAEARALKAEEQLEGYRALVRQHFYEPLLPEVGAVGKVDGYYQSYAQIDIHEQMLKDTARTEAYRNFIELNSELFKGKVVLDVGCGTGILSMFAARAGAERVFAVDNSDILYKAEQNAKDNGLDHQINFIKGKVEEVELPVEKVDVVISEWMGYFLLFEAMLDSVLVAKERFLAPNGVLCPNYCQIRLAGFSDSGLVKDKLEFWDDVYGFQMAGMKTMVYRDALVDTLDLEAVITSSTSIKDLPLMDITSEALDFHTQFELKVVRGGTLHGLVGYFDTLFTTGEEAGLNWEEAASCGIAPTKSDSKGIDYQFITQKLLAQASGSPVAFTTGPFGALPTHWRQTLFLFQQALEVEVGMVLSGSIKCQKRSANPRELEVDIKAQLLASDGSALKEVAQTFTLA
ncbi:hypothetical protein L0F63_004431 [Massospora cicadina]|nr:hypothetical protein L0F63_004431 [Massospora cicadina]